MGNLCLKEISDKMNERMNAFDFEKIDAAYKALLEG